MGPWIFWNSEELIGHSVVERLRMSWNRKRRSWRGRRKDEAERMVALEEAKDSGQQRLEVGLRT